MENAYIMTGTSFFTLQTHLKRAQVSHSTNSLAKHMTGEILEVDGGGDKEFLVPEGMTKKDGGTLDKENDGLLNADPAAHEHLLTLKLLKQMKAQFGQACTHNEQFIVAPCGVILARRTMFFAEALFKVAVYE
jgi:hypothetical protein